MTERQFAIVCTHRATYQEAYLKDVRSANGELTPAFGLRPKNLLTFTVSECASTLELLRCMYDDLWSFEPIALSVV